MARSADRWSGLAILGAAAIGPVAVRTPELLFATPAGPSPTDGPLPEHPLTLREEPSVPGSRRLRIGVAPTELDLEFSIPAPEVSGGQGPVARAAPRCYVVHAPLDAAQWETLTDARPEMVVLGNARVLFGEAEPFIRFVGELRRRLGASPVLWTPRVALPHRMALLAYLGVDLLDTTEGLARSVQGEYLDPEMGHLDEATARNERRCRCPACVADPPGSLRAHTEWAYADGLALVRTAIASDRLRDLVEARLPSEPVLAELLRYADRELRGILEARAPLTGPPNVTYVLRESHRRPEVGRFRRRLLERYVPPPSKRVLLLVPCSRTKPYRNSRSHRRFASAWEGLRAASRIHVVSVTSPLGLVPRELEDAFPARHYDIPVTGEWDEDERAAVIDALRHLLESGAYTDLVIHLDPEEYAFLKEVLPADRRSVWTLTDGGATRAEAIASLREALRDAVGSLEPPDGGPLHVVREELEALAAFQFGANAARRLFQAPVRLAGRPWFQRVTDGHGVDLATWREERGWFHLTVPGARRIFPAHPLEVEVAEGFELTGDLFTPGVARVDPSVRAGDAVLLTRRSQLLGVGEAIVPADLMVGLSHGAAVRVRHRNHGVASASSDDTHMTQERSPIVGRSSSG